VLAVNVFVKIDNVIYRKLQILVLVTPRLRHPSFDALSLGQAPRDIGWNVGLGQILEDSVPVPVRYAHVVPDPDRYPSLHVLGDGHAGGNDDVSTLAGARQ